MRFIALFAVFLLFNFSCRIGHQEDIKVINSEFDISPNDDKILFACYMPKEGVSIFELEIETGNVKLLVKSDKEFSYFNPKYSRDGKRILFVKTKKDGGNDFVCIANADGTNIVQLTKGSEIINKAILSDFFEDVVIYSKASEIKNYSPLSTVQPHKIDLFSLNINSKGIEQITYLDMFTCSGFTELDSSSMILGIMAGNERGFFYFDKDKPHSSRKFVPVNNPANDSTMYYEPVFSKENKLLAFITYFTIYTMDLKTKVAFKLYSDQERRIRSFCFYRRGKSMLFLRDGDFKFMSIDLDGKNLNEIPVNL